MKILAVINVFKRSFLTDYLAASIIGWMSQETDHELHVVVSDTMCSDGFRSDLHKLASLIKTKHKLSHIHFEDWCPVYVGFNGSILSMMSMKSDYDVISYCSEDCIMTKKTDLDCLLQEFNNPNVGIVSALVDNDNSQWYPHYNILDNVSRIVSLGESVNMHQFLFSRPFMEKYDFKYTDVFVAWATESLLTFFTEAVGMNWTHCQKVMLRHQRESKERGFDGYGLYARGPASTSPGPEYDEIIRPGLEFGLGFECCRGLYPFKPELYNEGKCRKRDELYNYIKNNLFLKHEQFNYDNYIKKSQFQQLI